MMSRTLSMIVLCACACASASPPHPISNTEPRDVEPLARAADDALAAILRPDYRRPFDPREIHYGEVRTMYLAACRAGDRRSCWMVPQLRDPDERVRDGSADDFIAKNCVAGDVMSCRALSSYDQRPGVPGASSRTAACRDNSQCDLAILDDDCVRGLPNACMLASGIATEARSAVYHTRFVALAVDGCKQGLLDECQSIRMFENSKRARDARIVAATQLCLITAERCGEASYAVGETTITARDLNEHECQISSRPLRRNLCSELVRQYAAHTYPEPVPNRFIDLRDWYCRAPVIQMPDICRDANLTRPIAGQ